MLIKILIGGRASFQWQRFRTEIPNQLAHNKVFVQGKDKRGCPVTLVIGARHFPTNGGEYQHERYSSPNKLFII